MIKIVILSTNKATISGLKQIFDAYTLDKLVPVKVEVFRDIKLLLKTDVSGAILFIDNIAGRSSVQTAEILREHDCPAQMVALIEDDIELALDAIKVQVFGALKVPIASKDVCDTIDRFVRQKLSNKVIIVKDGGQKLTLPANDILYVKSNARDVTVVTKNVEYPVTVPLFQVIAQLPEEFFSYCHRSYCVNLMNIGTVSKNIDKITMADGSVIPISRRRKSNFVAEREKFLQDHTFNF